MNRIRLLHSLSFIAAVFLSAAPGLAQVWTTASSYTEAKAKAKAEGKLILGDFGQVGCSDCAGMENLFHGTTLGISQKIQAGFVYLNENYNAPDTRPWTSKLSGNALPYVFYIDPDSPAGSSQSSSTGLIPSGNLSLTIKSLSYTLPLVVTNIPGDILDTNALQNGRLTLGGLARTNSPLAAAIRGAAIANVMWRVRDDAAPGGAFAPVTRMATVNSAFVSWAADFQPVNGTNAFESYVEYANGATSWTNTARFVYLGGPVEIPLTLNLSPATNHLSQGANATFTAQVSGGIPPYTNVTFQFGASDFSSAASPIYTNLVVIPTNMSDPTSVSITVSNVDSSNRGYYRVIAWDSSNASATSDPVSLDVIALGTTSQTISFASLTPKTYGDAPFALAATTSAPGLQVSYTSSNTNVAGISGSTVTIIGAGTAEIIASQLGDSTYAAASPISQTLTVNKATLTIAADAKTRLYGAPNPAWTFTPTGLVNGDTRASALRGNPVISTTATNTSVVGIYPINVVPGTLSAANYTLNFSPGTLTVNPAVLTVTADNKFMTPGTTLPSLTFTIAGFVNGDTQDPVVSGSPVISTTATAASGAGAYPITVTQGTLAAANYSFSFVSGTLTVGDNLPPNLAITSYSNLQTVAVRTITLSGTASDAGQGDDGIKSVAVNGGPAIGGTASSNNVANWSRVVSLVAGTNTFTVVATDNASSPNSVTKVIRIISDTVRPSVRITAPTLNQRWSNAVFSVKGTAGDNLGVAGVWCLTNGVWGLASTSNGWTNWTVDVALVPGNNTVKAYAVDIAGNTSPTNSVTFVYVATDHLQLSTVGNGTVSGNYSNAVLVVGTRYYITAIPGTNSLFSNWVESVAGSVVISSNTARLSFLMGSNLVLQANFVPNPFTPLQGTYNGLFFPTDNSFMATNTAATNSGFLGLALTSQGKYSGSLSLEGGTLPFTGQFDLGLQSQVSVARLGKPALTLSLQLNPTIYHPETDMTETNVLTGTVAEEGQWISALCAYRATTGNLNLYAGAYTFLLEGCDDWGLCFGDGFNDLPDGDAPASVKISSKGAIQVVGTLADGTAFTRTASASEQGLWPLYVPLYGGQGFLMGWVTLTTNQSASSVAWAMPPGLSGHYNTNGFVQSRLLLLTEYTAPPPGQNAVNWSNGTIKITGGDLPLPADSANVLQSQILVSNNIVRVISGTISNLTVSITASNGLFKGSFADPASKRPTSFRGALATDPGTPLDGGGWWLGSRGQGGNIRFVAP
jgi:hypothetical protein